MKHLFVDISSHGYGHLAQTAPILNALTASRPLQLTVRSGLAQAQLARRIQAPFTHIHAASDFGFVMHDALNVDLAASAARYREAYAHWQQDVAAETLLLKQLNVDLVLSNVSPLPLAGAAAASISSLAMCSLNWADLFAHYYRGQDWAAPIHAAMHSAYASAQAFIRFSPGMQMPDLPNIKIVGPVSAYGEHPTRAKREDVAHALDLPLEKRWLLVALGGIAHRLPVENWPELPGIQLLLPADWQITPRADITPYSDAQIPFADLLPLMDVVLSKPGYGTFVEAACCGLPVLYLQRPDWPEAECLEDWLHRNARATIVPPAAAQSGDLQGVLKDVLAQVIPPRPVAAGMQQALLIINAALDGSDTIKP